jgi:hypothetical protein
MPTRRQGKARRLDGCCGYRSNLADADGLRVSYLVLCSDSKPLMVQSGRVNKQLPR